MSSGQRRQARALTFSEDERLFEDTTVATALAVKF